MMSQQNAVPKYQLVISSGAGASPAKRGKGRPPRFNDVEQAVNSITYTNNSAGAGAVRGKGNSTLGAAQADKILFLPKYVQKKVTVMRDVPRKTFDSPGGSGQPALKKKKLLGDLALQSWAAPKLKEPEEVASESPSLLCRVCGSLIEDTVIPLISENGELSSSGSKLKTIVGSDIAENPLYPTSCCKPCSFKINVCFTLLLELQASDEVVRLTYAELQEGDLINPGAHIYTCSDCGQEVVGMRDFITHYEQHMQAKTIGTENNVKIKAKDEVEDDIAERAQMYLDQDVDDGSIIYQNEAGELICEKCGRTFKYRFLLQLHRKAPKRGHMRDASPPAKVCFVCKQARVSTVSSNGYCVHLDPNKEEGELVGEDYEESENESQPPIQFVSPDEQEVPAESSEYEGTSDAPEIMQWEDASSEEEDNPPPQIKKKAKVVEKVQCDICLKMVKAGTLATHVLKQHEKGRFFCDVCDETFAYEAMLKAHRRTHQVLEMEGDDYPVRVNHCQYCDKKLPGLSELREHLKEIHNEEWTQNNHFTCRDCRKPFYDFFRMRMHLLLYHDIDLPKKFLKRKGSADCDLCQKTLRSEYQLKLHMREEHHLTNSQMESLKEACEKCGKRFSVRVNLVNHINSAHRMYKPLECDYCGERFGKCSSLIMHKRRHTGEKPFVCCVCERPYRQRNDVLRHLARHVRDREVLFNEAYATNTSDSHRVTMRYIYLKDSSQKGISEMLDNGPVRKVTKVRRDTHDRPSRHEFATEDESEMNGMEPIEEENTNAEYVVNDEGQLVLQETMEETIVDNEMDNDDEALEQYILVDGVYVGPDGGRYRLDEHEDGSTVLVRIDGDTVKEEDQDSS